MMRCPCCGCELSLVSVESVPESPDVVQPVVRVPLSARVAEVHDKSECRVAVRRIKQSRQALFYRGARVLGAFSSHGVIVRTPIGLQRVYEWADVKNRAGRSVLLDLWVKS